MQCLAQRFGRVQAPMTTAMARPAAQFVVALVAVAMVLCELSPAQCCVAVVLVPVPAAAAAAPVV